MRALVSILLMPSFSLAAPQSFKDLIMNMVLPIIDQISKILIGLAILIFFWNIARSLWGEHSAEKTKKLTNIIAWGVLIIFVMVSIWGILRLLRYTLLHGSGL